MGVDGWMDWIGLDWHATAGCNDGGLGGELGLVAALRLVGLVGWMLGDTNCDSYSWGRGFIPGFDESGSYPWGGHLFQVLMRDARPMSVHRVPTMEVGLGLH